jgi:hypothetical protein
MRGEAGTGKLKDERTETQEQKAFASFWFARHGRALTGASPEHDRVVGNV